MKHSLKIIISICILFTQQMVYTQTDVWPVQISGTMNRPLSLDLKVYSLERAEDLSYTVVLRDPIQSTLNVKPVISIEQNGTIIYQTDPNFGGNQILLNQFEQMHLDGSALAQYISNTALIGVKPNTTGSVEVPEGFNQICLQLYGVDRYVPVSNKFCLSGNFRLNQPPQIVKPAFNEKIKMLPVQNTIFSWQPMHLGSGNNPGAVEYLFEIVELPMGVMNANDAFPSALRIYSTTTMSTSLIYTQAEPMLEPNKIYAWRVTAKSILYPTSKLFQNDGKSEVSMFMYYDGEKPDTELNPFDDPTPRGCSVYETSYRPVSKTVNEPAFAAANQLVKVGYFNMKLMEVNGNQFQGFSGTGVVEYPMLRSAIPVEFKGLKVNKDGRVYEAENIEALLPKNLKLSNSDLNKDNINQAINSDYLLELNSVLDNTNSNILSLPENNLKLNELPLQFKATDKQPDIAVTGIRFTPQSAYINLVGQSLNGSVYAATHIASTPYGIKNNSYLVPISIGGKSSSAKKLLESIEFGRVASLDSKLFCDCKGLKSLNESSSLNIAPNIMTQINNQGLVTLELADKSNQLDNYIGSIKKIPEFEINGLDGYKFKANGGYLDLSQSQNNSTPDDIGYKESQNPSWQGVAMNDVAVTIPEKLNFFNQDKQLTLDKGSLFVDDIGVAYGHFYKTDVLNLSKGKMGPWNYSIDTMQVVMNKKHVGDFNISGQIKTPFFDDNFPYSAVVQESNESQTYLVGSIINSALSMSMWKGKFKSEDPSEIKANLFQQDNKYTITPKCKFFGELSINLTDQEFRSSILNKNKAEIIEELLKTFNLNSLDLQLSDLKLEGLSHDPFNEESKKYKIDRLDYKDVVLSFGKQSDKLKDATFVVENKDKEVRLGLKLVIIKGNNKIEMIVWSKSNANDFNFEGIEIKNIELKCNCTAFSVIPSPEAWDQIIDQYIEENYSHSIGYNGSLNRLNSTFAYDINKILLSNKIKSEAISWFPRVADNKIFIPFLNKNLLIDNKNGTFSGQYKDVKFSKVDVVWDNALFEALENAQGEDLKLPIVINSEFWNLIGFKSSYNLPENFKLIISKFSSKANDQLMNAVVSMDLVAELSIDNEIKYVHFGTLEDIPIGPNSIDLKDRIFYLLKSVDLNKNISFFSTKNRALKSAAPEEMDSYVRINCDKGVELFNIVGNYVVDPKTINALGTKKGASLEPATFGFKLIENKIADNYDLLRSFIAPLRTDNFKEKKWQPWSFTAQNAKHIQFKPTDQFEAYLDFDDTNNPPESILDDYFTGLYFKSLKFDIPELEASKTPDGKTVSYSDVTNPCYFNHLEQNFNLKYSDTTKVIKANSATLGTWQYVVDSIAYNIEANELDENQLFLKGKIRIPIFKDAPDKGKEQWLKDYNDAWVDYQLNLGYSDNLEVSGYLQEVEDKIFESVHIDGVGFKLENGSSLEMGYNGNSLMAKAIFCGRIFYTIKPLNASISTLKFQDLKLNYATSSICKGEGLVGINSLEFGTWSPALFSPTEMAAIKKVGEMAGNTEKGKKLTQKVTENKFYKKFGGLKEKMNQIANFEINIHEPVFSCGSSGEQKLTIGLELNISRDGSNLTESQQAAYDANHPEETMSKDVASSEKSFDNVNNEYRQYQINIKQLAKERNDAAKEFDDFIIKNKMARQFVKNNDLSSPPFQTKEGKEAREKLSKIADIDDKMENEIKKVKEKWKEVKKQRLELKTKKDKLDNIKNIRIDKENKAKASIAGRASAAKQEIKDQWKNAKETKTFSITAGGDIDIVFTNKEFKRVELNCLKLGGKFGPVGFTGGLNIFREDVPGSTTWGNGFLGLVKVSVLNNEFAAKFQTGVKSEVVQNSNSIEDYRYWFADLSFSSEVGIPLGQTGFAFTGVGGGFYYNMGRDLPQLVKFENQKDEASSSSNKKDNNKCKMAGLEPGVSLSGLIYKTSRYSMGGYLSVEISHKSRISAEVIVGLQVKNDPSGLKFENFGLDINGYCFYEDYLTRKAKSPLIVKSNLTLSNDEDISLSGNIKFRFNKAAGSIQIEAPKQVSSNLDDGNNWNTLVFYLSKKDQFFRAGSWKLPNREESKGPKSGMSYLNASFTSPLINAFAGLYCQIGSAGNVDALPTASYLMGSDGFTDKIDKSNPLNKLKSSSSLEMMAGFRLEANMSDKFFVVSYSANGLIGANIRLSKVSTTSNKCVEFGKIGFSNGYYASGNAFADLKMKVVLEASIDIVGFTIKGSYPILDGGVKAAMNFGFPNPSFLTGKVEARYSVLNGLIKGQKTVNIDVGKQPCAALEPDPTIGIVIHDKIFPADGAKDIKFLKKIEITNKFGEGEKIPINPNGLSGGASTAKEYTIYPSASSPATWLKAKGTNKLIKVNPVWSEDKKNLTLHILEELEPNTTYIVFQDYRWKKGTETIGEEKLVTEFTTGEFDDEINHDLVKSSMPGKGQRYWRAGYGYPKIVFQEDESQIRKIFPSDKSYFYYVEVVEQTADGIQKYHRVPVSQYPFGSDAESLYPYELDQRLANDYRDKYFVSIREFNKLNLGKGSLCLFKLVRAIDKKANIEAYDRNHVESDSIRYIYEYHFGTSTYSTMTEKLNDIKNNWNPETKSIMQSERDIKVKDEIISEYVDKGIASGDPIPEDKIWGFKAKVEGFDKFDIALLNDNLLFTWDTTFGVYKWICERYESNFKKYDGPITKFDSKYNLGFGPAPFFPYKSYMKQTYWKIGAGYSLASPYLKILAPNNNKSELLELTNDEIKNKKLLIRKASSDFNDQYSNSGPNDYDFMVEDGIASTMVLMSRIVVDAMNEFNEKNEFGTIEPIKKGQFEVNNYTNNPKTYYPANLTFSFYEDKKNGYCYYYDIPFENKNVILKPVILIDYKNIDVKKLSK